MIRTTPTQRQRFAARHASGRTYREIATDEQVSRECVRYWCRRFKRGVTVRSPPSSRPGGLLSRFSPRLRYALLRLRLQHPHWGPARLRYHLAHRPSLRGVGLPSESSLGRYLHQWTRFRRPPRFRPVRERPLPPTRVHQRWQIDFKLGIALRDGTRVNLHTVRDPVGAACLGAQLFPASQKGKRHSSVTYPEVRAVLRRCFARWGTLPAEVQTDGEPVLLGRQDDPFPSVFTLWLKGLGIEHRVIRPGRPTDNAEVERCHRTIHDYGIVGNEKLAWRSLQAQLDQAVYALAFELGSRAEGCEGRPPVSAHPELLQRPRPFEPAEELAHFDLSRVDAYLSTLRWKRRADVNGQITIAGRHTKYSVGRRSAHREVWVRFDPHDRSFVFSPRPDSDLELGRRRARGLEIADLTGLEVWPEGAGTQQLRLPLDLGLGVSC